MIAQPEPKREVLARRDAIVAGLRALLPESGVIAEPLRLKPYETDGLAAYRQAPLAAARPMADAVVVGMMRMNSILDIDYGNRFAVVQAGVTNIGITTAVADEKFFY